MPRCPVCQQQVGSLPHCANSGAQGTAVAVAFTPTPSAAGRRAANDWRLRRHATEFVDPFSAYVFSTATQFARNTFYASEHSAILNTLHNNAFDGALKTAKAKNPTRRARQEEAVGPVKPLLTAEDASLVQTSLGEAQIVRALEVAGFHLQPWSLTQPAQRQALQQSWGSLSTPDFILDDRMLGTWPADAFTINIGRLANEARQIEDSKAASARVWQTAKEKWNKYGKSIALANISQLHRDVSTSDVVSELSKILRSDGTASKYMGQTLVLVRGMDLTWLSL